MIIRSNYFEDFEDNYFTKNRKLKLEEYDDEGNLIDVIEFNQGELWSFYTLRNNSRNKFELARKKDREYFKGEKLKLANNLMFLFNDYYFDENIVKAIEEILNTYTNEEIEFALDFKYQPPNKERYFLTMKDYNEVKRMDFIDVLNWIKESDGMYYAVANDGSKGVVYFEKPTKKQAKYQRQKNSKRIAFLNFRDWKEYLINEDELE